MTYYASVVHTDLFLTGGPGSHNEGNPYLCSSFILENWLEVPKCPFLGGAFWDYLKAHRLRKLSTNDYSSVEKVYIWSDWDWERYLLWIWVVSLKLYFQVLQLLMVGVNIFSLTAEVTDCKIVPTCSNYSKGEFWLEQTDNIINFLVYHIPFFSFPLSVTQTHFDNICSFICFVHASLSYYCVASSCSFAWHTVTLNIE